MTSFSDVRCRNCQIGYECQDSGYGCLDDYNHSDYCQECWEAASKAMEKIPKKREQVRVPTDEISFSELEKEYEKRLEKSSREGFFAPRRFFMPMFSMTSDDSTLRRELKIGAVTYQFTKWHESGEIIGVEKVMEKDLITGEIIGNWSRRNCF